MQPAIDRFLAKIERDEETGCWLWTASIRPNGYGQFRFSTEKNGYPHLFAYEHYVGSVPAGMEIDHRCRNRACVNPEHLEAVTHRVNVHRGTSPSAKNRTKTHCKRGHEFTDASTYVKPNGNRVCRVCMREHQERWRAENLEHHRAYHRDYQRARREAA